VISSNFGPILHISEIENRQFVPIPVSFNAIAWDEPVEFRDEPEMAKIVFDLSGGEVTN